MTLSLSPTQNGEHITLFPRAPRPDSLWCDHVGRGSQQDKVGHWQVKGSTGLKAASCPQTALRPAAELLFQSCHGLSYTGLRQGAGYGVGIMELALNPAGQPWTGHLISPSLHFLSGFREPTGHS